MPQRRNMHGLSVVNPWITEQKTSYFYGTGYYCTHILKIIFSTFFFQFRLVDSIVVKTLLFFRFLIFHVIM